MYRHVPNTGATPRPLVLLLHGCSQSGEDHARESGWLALADQAGFVVVVAEQSYVNNQARCFNWFLLADTSAGSGEVESLRQMVAHTQDSLAIDPARIHVVGLSAGGAMAVAFMALHPSLVASGATTSALPFRCATSAWDAYACMTPGTHREAAAWGDLVRGATSHLGPWPRLTAWHGMDDLTVAPANADELAAQWTNLHGLPAAPTSTRVEGRDHVSEWRDGQGRVVVDVHLLERTAHGALVDPDNPEHPCGALSLNTVDADTCAARVAAGFMGLLPEQVVDGGPVPDGSAGPDAGVGVSSSTSGAGRDGGPPPASSGVSGSPSTSQGASQGDGSSDARCACARTRASSLTLTLCFLAVALGRGRRRLGRACLG
jgi:poly(hydroxyalkanoate) depolymerase family esterase